MTALFAILALVIVLAVAYTLLEKRPGYGVYYGLEKLTGSRLDIGPVDWTRLTRHATPNDALVCPAEHCPSAKPDREPKVYRLPSVELLARLRKIALGESHTDELTDAPTNGARFLQRTRLMRYPDTIDVDVVPVGSDQSTLAIYSRSLIGRKDFGVNRARITRWLAALG